MAACAPCRVPATCERSHAVSLCVFMQDEACGSLTPQLLRVLSVCYALSCFAPTEVTCSAAHLPSTAFTQVAVLVCVPPPHVAEHGPHCDTRQYFWLLAPAAPPAQAMQLSFLRLPAGHRHVSAEHSHESFSR